MREREALGMMYNYTIRNVVNYMRALTNGAALSKAMCKTLAPTHIAC